MAVAGPLAEGFISFDFLDPDSALAGQFTAAYAKTYGGVMSPWAAVRYNATRLLFEAMRRAGSVMCGWKGRPRRCATMLMCGRLISAAGSLA